MAHRHPRRSPTLDEATLRSPDPGSGPGPGPGSRSGGSAPTAIEPLRSLHLHRSRQRVLAGVAGGLAERLRVDPTIIRVGFVLLSLCAGVGLLAYAVAWASLPQEDPGGSRGAPGEHTRHDAGVQRGVAVSLVIAGIVIALRAAGFWVGDALAWSVSLVTLGVAIIWLRGDDGERARWTRMAREAPATTLDALGGGRIGTPRLAAGALLFAAGLTVFLAGTNALQVRSNVVLAVAVTAAGVALVAGPWGWRLLSALGEERRERIRSQERAAMAAHLHDSVLQTLALIQRTDQPREMVALARNQERELRAWLNGRPGPAGDTGGSLAASVEKAAASVELQFKVPVEVVTVGDAALDERLQGIVDACREATVNAAKHSGADKISVYLEVEPQAVTAYVRDQGRGFDPQGVAPDRRGISASILGRMQRSGGTATIGSEPGCGTEVHLVLPRASTGGPARGG